MKPCPNCRTIHPDEYNGQCQDCGAPLGLAGASRGLSDMSGRLARQRAAGQREAGLEQALARGDYGRVKPEDGLMEVARAGAFLLEKAAGRGQDWE